MTPLIDVALIRRRQIDLGVTDNDIAKCFGRGHGALRPFWDGKNHKFIDLRALFTLGDILGLDPRDLLLRNGARDLSTTDLQGAEDSAPLPTPISNDMATLCAFLVRTGALSLVDGICEALAWDRSRFEEAVERLAADLPARGLTIRRSNGQVGVVPADIGHAIVPLAGVRLGSIATGLKNTAARELIRILEGQQYPRNLMKGPRGVSVSYLRIAGLVIGWPPQPTPACSRGMLMSLVWEIPTPTVPYRPSNPTLRLGDKDTAEQPAVRQTDRPVGDVSPGEGSARSARGRDDRERQRTLRKRVRQWARSNGFVVSDMGRIPESIQAAYDNRAP